MMNSFSFEGGFVATQRRRLRKQYTHPAPTANQPPAAPTHPKIPKPRETHGPNTESNQHSPDTSSYVVAHIPGPCDAPTWLQLPARKPRQPGRHVRTHPSRFLACQLSSARINDYSVTPMTSVSAAASSLARHPCRTESAGALERPAPKASSDYSLVSEMMCQVRSRAARPEPRMRRRVNNRPEPFKAPAWLLALTQAH
ncbi:hypothetical protein ABIB45_004591 [Arthrobacter sp. UYCo732]